MDSILDNIVSGKTVRDWIQQVPEIEKIAKG